MGAAQLEGTRLKSLKSRVGLITVFLLLPFKEIRHLFCIVFLSIFNSTLPFTCQFMFYDCNS